MNKKKPTYNELEVKLAKTEELITKLQKSEVNPMQTERDTAILSTKELAEAYLASEQNFKNSVDNCPLGIRIITEDGELIYANKAALNIFGFNTVEELAAMKRQELYTPESYAAHQERKKRRKLKQHVPGEYELTIKRPDGEVRNLTVFRREVMWGGEKQYMAMYEDITEHKRAEEALKREQAFLSNVINSIPEGISILDKDLNIVMVPKTTEKQYAHAMPLVGKKCYEAYHGRSEPCEVCPTKQTLQTGKAANAVIRRHGADGQITGWSELISYPLIEGQTGEITGVIEYGRDITERKQAEEALRESEEKYHSLVEHSNDGIVFIEDGLINYCNTKMLEIGGYTKEDLIDKPFIDFIVPEQKGNVAELYKKRIAGLPAPERYELDLVSKEGNVIHTEISSSIFYLRQKPVDIAIIRDITDRKKMDEALRQSEELFAKSFRSSPDAVAISTLEEGIIIDMNDAAIKDTGYSINELVGHSIYELSPWVKQEDHEKIIEVLKNNGKISQMEYQFRTKSGEIKTWEISAEPIVIGGKNCIISVQRDITDKKRVEQALRESEEKFSKAFHASPDAIAIVTLKDDKYIDINDSYARMTDYSKEELIGNTTSSKKIWVNDEEHVKIQKMLQEQGRIYNKECEYRTKSGEIRTRLFSLEPITIKGEPCTIGLSVDITERKRAEEALRASEEKYKTILNTALDGFWVVNNQSKILEVNDSYCKMIGYAREELLKMTLNDIEAGESPEEIDRHRETIIRQGSDRFETRHRRKDGQIIDVETSIIYHNATPGVAYAFFHDITNRKRAEKALQESEERYRLLFENSKDAILLTSPERGEILAVNPEGCRMFGKSEEEICRTGRGSVIDSSDPRLEEALEKRRLTGEFSGELTGIRADGTRFPIDVSSRVFYDKEEKARTSMIIRDISERKRMEEQLEADSQEIKLIIDSSPLLVFYTNLEGKFLRANKAFTSALNTTEEELVGKTVFDLYSKDIAQGMKDDDNEVFKSGIPKLNIIEKYESASGLRWVQTDKIPIFDKDGKVIGLAGFAQDITERKRMEQALRESEEKFSKAFHASPLAVVISTIEDGKIIEINDSFTRLSGYTREEVVGRLSSEFVSITKKDRESGLRDLKEQGTISANNEYEIRIKSGEIRTWLSSADLIDIGGERYVISVSTDITERKQAEEALKESEERFNKAFHASPNMMSVVSLEDGRIIDVNEEHTRITGYERQEVIGKSTLELNLWTRPEQRAELYRMINADGRVKNFESLLRTKSGEIKTMLLSAEKITLRGINCLVVSAMDITERKEAEKRINYLNLTLRSIRDVSEVITREKDRSLLIQKVCDSLVKSRSFVGVWIVLLDDKQQLVTWAEANTSKDFPALIEQIKQNNMPQCVKRALKQRQVVVTEDYSICKSCPVHTPDFDIGSMTVRLEIEGKIYGVLCAAVPQKKLLHDEEEMALFVEIASDISFALRDMELVAANELREQESMRMAKIESIGMLAGGIAHDFNNLLTGIMGNIGLVKTYVSPSDPTYEMLDEAEAAAIRAKDLTQQLLTFARGGKPLKRLINPAEVIKASAEFAMRGSKAKLELSFPDDLWPIEADEGQINQAINNIALNADEAMPTGGTLKITAENVQVKKSDALPIRSGNYIRINIKDTGIGISPAHLQRIFEPYFTTKRKGSGLGLTSAYSIVKNHGGIILIDSELNKGSTFRIYLPATKKALKGAKKLTVEESGQAGGKVLIMDDEEIIRKMLKNMLGLAGYTVELSADGAEALEKYKQAKEARDPFNAVIMDLTIPGGMGGKEAVNKLLEMDPEATVIVSSGYATDPIMSDYKKYGFKAVIAKPYSVKQLRDLLSRLLAKKKR